MTKPKLKKENVKILLETKYINVADLEYDGTKHYYSVSRKKDAQVPLKSDEEFKSMLPDAVSCFVIVREQGKEPGLLLTKEFRYPCGQFLLSPPAGLLDDQDISSDNPLISAAIREIKEETGLEIKDTDRIFEVNRLCFSSPGMTDESNGLICAVVDSCEGISFNADSAEQTERIGDYKLYTREEAKAIINDGRDSDGYFFSVYTWMALMYFLSGYWEE